MRNDWGIFKAMKDSIAHNWSSKLKGVQLQEAAASSSGDTFSVVVLVGLPARIVEPTPKASKSSKRIRTPQLGSFNPVEIAPVIEPATRSANYKRAGRLIRSWSAREPLPVETANAFTAELDGKALREVAKADLIAEISQDRLHSPASKQS